MSIFKAYCLTFQSKWNERKLRKVSSHLGANPHLYGKIGIDVNGQLSIGDNFVCTSGNMSNPMGANFRSYLRVNGGGQLSIGQNVGMSSSTIWCASKITIGDYVKIGAMCIITDTDCHSLNPMLRMNSKTDACNAKSAPVLLEDNCFIGARSIICKGVTIGANSIVGIGSVVTKSIPANQIWAGNPARFIREI